MPHPKPDAPSPDAPEDAVRETVGFYADPVTMPGLPRRRAAEQIDINEAGETVGLF